MSLCRRPLDWLPRIAGLLICLVVVPASLAADVAATVKEIRERIDGSGKRLDDGDEPGAVESLTAALEALRKLAAEPKPPAAYRGLVERAAGMRRRMDRAGIDVSALALPGEAAAAPATKPVTKPKAAGNAVSFSNDVAPLITRACGGCHVSGRKGGFQAASYDALMKSGMVQRGAGRDSRLVEVILTGDMPRGGGKVSSDEVGKLIAWIDAGAGFDGTDPTAGLDALGRAPAAPRPAAPPPDVRAVPLQPGEVSFAIDVVPLLKEACLRCHGGDETENGLSMATIQSLLRGGRTGPAVVPRRGAESLLVKKLRGVGIEGQRMPLGRPPLADAEIAKIQKWIDEGARLDLLTATTPLATLAAAGRARSLSNAELADVRAAAGNRLWSRAIPDETASVERRDGVILMGNLPAERLGELAALAAQVEPKVRAELVRGAGALVKGGVVVYVFRQGVDYSAFWQTAEKAERPRGLAGHAGMLGDVVYGAVLLPPGDEMDDTRLVCAEQVAAAAFAARTAPPWFAAGAGRAVAQRIAPKAPLAAQWRRDLPAAFARIGSAADFLGGHGDAVATATVAGGFVGAIAAPGKLAQLVAHLDDGIAFDDAFGRVFRVTPAQAFERWASRGPK